MSLWLLLAADFVIQEPISSSVLLLAAYQEHYDLWLVSLLFLAMTSLDACVGYWLGLLLKRRFAASRFSAWLARKSERFGRIVGTRGKRMALLIWGPNLFPYTALITPWFGYSFTENLVLSIIGDTVLWYGSEWLIVFGVKTFVGDPIYALFAVAGAMLAIAFIYQAFVPRKSRA